MRDTHRGLTAAAALLAACALALVLLPTASVSAYADGEEGDEELVATATDDEEAAEEEASAAEDESESEEESDADESDESDDEATDDDESEDEDTDVTTATYVVSDDLTDVTISDNSIAYFEYTPSESGYYVVAFVTNEIYREDDEETGEMNFLWYIDTDVDGYVSGFGDCSDDYTIYYSPYFTCTLEAGETYVFAFENYTGSDIVVSSVTAEVVKSINDGVAEVTFSGLTYELPEGGLSYDDVYADIVANLTVTYDGEELVFGEDYAISLWAEDPITSPGVYSFAVYGGAIWYGEGDYYGVVVFEAITVTLPSSSLIELTVDGGAVEATLEADGAVYYCFTPESDGYYQVTLSSTTAAWAEVLNSDWSYMNIDYLYADSEETGVQGGYFEAGQTYYIAVYDDSGEGGTVSVEVTSWDAPVTEITELDVAYEITSSEDWWVSYAVFSPTTSGTYTITLELDDESTYGEFWFFDENGYDVDSEWSWEDSTLTIVAELEAGVTYQLQLYLYWVDEDGNTIIDGTQMVTITVSSDEEGAGLASAVLGSTSDATDDTTDTIDTSATDTSSSTDTSSTADTSTTSSTSTSSSSTSSSSSSDSTVPATGDDAASAAAPLALSGVAACALGLALRRRRAR